MSVLAVVPVAAIGPAHFGRQAAFTLTLNALGERTVSGTSTDSSCWK